MTSIGFVEKGVCLVVPLPSGSCSKRARRASNFDVKNPCFEKKNEGKFVRERKKEGGKAIIIRVSTFAIRA